MLKLVKLRNSTNVTYTPCMTRFYIEFRIHFLTLGGKGRGGKGGGEYPAGLGRE